MEICLMGLKCLGFLVFCKFPCDPVVSHPNSTLWTKILKTLFTTFACFVYLLNIMIVVIPNIVLKVLASFFNFAFRWRSSNHRVSLNPNLPPHKVFRACLIAAWIREHEYENCLPFFWSLGFNWEKDKNLTPPPYFEISSLVIQWTNRL